MSDMATLSTALPAPPREQPRSEIVGPWAWMKANLFNSWFSTAVTLVLGYVILRALVGFVGWAFVSAIWSVPYNARGIPDTSVCQMAKGTGACWAVIADKYRLIL